MKIKTLHVSVADKIATYQARDGEIVCGNSGYKIQFAFDSEWDEYTAKTAVFKWNFQHVEIPFTGDTCSVPIIKNATSLIVGVYAGDLCTTTEATIGAKRSVLCNMGEHADPPEDVYNQLMALIGNIHGETPYIGENGNWWIGEEDTGVSASGGGVIDLPLSKGTGENSIVIDEGNATGANSIAGGTTDLNLVKSVLGEGYAELINKYGGLANMPDSIISLILNAADVGYTASEFKRMATVSPAIAEALLSISLGASNKSKTAASISLGFGNIAGAKGYYITEINTSQKTITLSTKQASTVAPSSVGWSAGDRLFIVNDDRYWAEIASINGNVITLVDMPFSSLEALKTVSIPLVGSYDITNPTERSVINIDKPESGEVDIGWGAIAIGSLNQVLASCGYGVGYKNTVAGDFGTAFGQENTVGYSAFASGIGNQAKGRASHAEGDNTQAIANCAHAEGHGSQASGSHSHAESYKTTASGYASHAEGNQTKATNEEAHAEGYMTEASGKYSHAEGSNTIASKRNAHAEGHSTQATGEYSHSEGESTIASGNHSHAEGLWSVAAGKHAHAEGDSTHADGQDSHAEGLSTQATGRAAHAEGCKGQAKGDHSHAEGADGIAEGQNSHVQNWGCHTTEEAGASHAGGEGSKASAYAAFAHGVWCIANEFGQHVVGLPNEENPDAVFICGNGEVDPDTYEPISRSNAFEVLKDGSINVGGVVLSPANLQKLLALLQ